MKNIYVVQTNKGSFRTDFLTLTELFDTYVMKNVIAIFRYNQDCSVTIINVPAE